MTFIKYENQKIMSLWTQKDQSRHSKWQELFWNITDGKVLELVLS